MIANGTRLGAYEVLAPIGAGGMGEVYRARDTRLDRIVAIKILPSHVSSHPKSRERFQREARVISSLNHPHICTLFDVGSEDGADFLVMEHLEGETLADRVARGPLPLPQILKIGGEICEALERAHAAGIVHRDLKPGNVMLTPSGAKLLDFGLAKMDDREIADFSAATQRQPLTEEGATVGTLQYMAPEQIEGRSATARSDIFALGLILYEMATGRRAFEGKSRQSTIAAILEGEPPPMSGIRAVPPLLDEIVRKCLEKDPDARWDSAHDVRLLLESASRGVEPSRAKSGLSSMIAWSIAAAAILAAIGIALWSRRRVEPATFNPIHFTVAMPPGTRLLGRAEETVMAVSPDGTKIAICAANTAGRTLFVRSLDSNELQRLPGTDGAQGPFWSPDSTRIGFFGDGKLKTVGLDGAQPREYAIEGTEGIWTTAEQIIIGSAVPDFRRVDVSSGAMSKIMDRLTDGGWTAWPFLLPDGKHLLLTVYKEPSPAAELRSFDIESHKSERVALNRSRVEYAAGKLYFVRDGALMSQPFDPATRRLSGEPSVITPAIAYFRHTGMASFSVSADARVIAFQGGFAPSQLTWIDRNGHELGKLGEPGEIATVRISPDARRVITSRIDSRFDISDFWMIDVDRNLSTRFTNTDYTHGGAVWSPDGRTVAFAADKFGPPEIFFKSIDSNREYDSKLGSGDYVQVPTDWLPDNRLFFTDLGRARNAQLYVQPLGGNAPHQRLRTSAASEMHARSSPDGKWIAYTSNESGENEIYAVPSDGTRAPIRVSNAGGREAVWRRDGRELFFLDSDDWLNAVSENGAFGPPSRLFRIAPGVGNTRLDPIVGNTYDAAPDGQRFLVNLAVNGQTDLPLNVIVR
jgi:Tol biopolymer transport system component